MHLLVRLRWSVEVGFNADPQTPHSFQKKTYPNLWFLPVQSFLDHAPIHFNAIEIAKSAWTVQDKEIRGFPGLTAAVKEAAEKLNLAAPMEKLLAFTSPDGKILIKYHLIQPEVQVISGRMAANKEFDAAACEKTWTLSWQQVMETGSQEKYKLSMKTTGDPLVISVIPFNPAEKTLADHSTPMQTAELFRCAHFPIRNGNKCHKPL